MQRHTRNREELPTRNPDILFAGNSLVQGWNSRGRYIWDRCYEPRKAAQIGYVADKTQHLLWRIENGEIDGISPKVVILLIGTNNQRSDSPRHIFRGIKSVINEIERRLPESQIIVMTMLPCRKKGHPFRNKIEAANTLLRRYVQRHDELLLLDLWNSYLEEDGTLNKGIGPDTIHLTKEGYLIWHEALIPLLEKQGIPMRGCR